MCLYADELAEKRYASQFSNIYLQRWHPYIVNVLQQDVSKSLAIKVVLDYFNISPENAIAFGDGDNDIDMLEYVGLGIAMGNGSTALKVLPILLQRNLLMAVSILLYVNFKSFRVLRLDCHETYIAGRF